MTDAAKSASATKERALSTGESFGYPPLALYKQDRRCPKCNSLGVTSRHCAKTWDGIGLYWPQQIAFCWIAGGYADHMHRVCPNCSHEFYERPADTKASDYTEAALQERAQKWAAEQLKVIERHEEKWTAYNKPVILTDPPKAKRGWFG